MDYPRLVYRSASEHMLVHDDTELSAAMDDGWYASVPEARNKVHAIQIVLEILNRFP